MESEHMALKARVESLEKQIPEMVAALRQDMLRAMGSVVERTDENIKAATVPMQEQLTPITEALKRTHILLKWVGGTIVTLAIGTITSVVIALVLQWLTLK